MTEEQLKVSFSNYERTVWVINSVEGHLLRYYRDVLICFDRFPAFPMGDGSTLTPDFAVSFINDFHFIGEVKRALGLDQRTIEQNFEQLVRYDQNLKFRRAPGEPHDWAVASHDLVLFVNVEHARKEAKKLRQLIEADGRPTRPVIIFHIAYDQQQAKARWILSCITDLSGRFSDAQLPEEKRLSIRHQDNEEPIVIYTNEFAALQATQSFCNDDPPNIYTAVILWARVFPRLMPSEQRATWVLEANLQGISEFGTTIEAILTERERLRLRVRKKQVIEAIQLLAQGKLVVQDGDGLLVRYRRFRPARVDEDDDDAAEAAIDYTKAGLIREISRGASGKTRQQLASSHGRKGSRHDPNQLPLL
jgi:hypothetical protein